MATVSFGALDPVLRLRDCEHAGGTLVTAALKNVEPEVASALVGHPAWASVRGISMPGRLYDRSRAAVEQLAFRNPTLRLESAMNLDRRSLVALVASEQRPHALGIQQLYDAWQVLDELLALAPRRLVIENAHVTSFPYATWGRFWSSSWIREIDDLEMRFATVGHTHWQALRDHAIRHATITHSSYALAWSSPPPRLRVPAITPDYVVSCVPEGITVVRDRAEPARVAR
jgi:hypothetical protein